MVSTPLQVGNKGKIVKVLGPVVDVEFPDALPGIYNALTVEYTVQNQPAKITLEVQQHLGDKWVRRSRCLAPRASNGASRLRIAAVLYPCRSAKASWAGCST
jgi:F0F1-type ATP synthase beta subunit